MYKYLIQIIQHLLPINLHKGRHNALHKLI